MAFFVLNKTKYLHVFKCLRPGDITLFVEMGVGCGVINLLDLMCSRIRGAALYVRITATTFPPHCCEPIASHGRHRKVRVLMLCSVCNTGNLPLKSRMLHSIPSGTMEAV